MSSEVKARIRWRDNEIEFQGTKSEVDGLLDKWWSRLHVSRDEMADESNPVKKKRAAKTRSPEPNAPESETQSFNAADFANSLKEETRFPDYQNKVLHQKDGYNKIALVCWYLDVPLTSGEITNALKALDIKADQGYISRTIKANSGRFTASHPRKKGGSNRPRYKLTSHARSEFTALLEAKA